MSVKFVGSIYSMDGDIGSQENKWDVHLKEPKKAT